MLCSASVVGLKRTDKDYSSLGTLLDLVVGPGGDSTVGSAVGDLNA